MGKVIKSELNQGQISQILNLLDDDMSDTNELILKLSFFSNSTDLKGKDYDLARKKATKYVEILTKRYEVAESLRSGFSSACSQLANFMEEYTDLDDGEIPTLEEYLSQVKRTYSSIVYRLYSTPVIDENAEVISYLRGQMDYYDSIIYKIEKELNKLKELSKTVASLYGSLIEPGCQNIISYRNRVDSVQLSNITVVSTNTTI